MMTEIISCLNIRENGNMNSKNYVRSLVIQGAPVSIGKLKGNDSIRED